MRVVTVTNVTGTYPLQSMPSVDDVSFFLEQGSYTAIVGLNGSGKSTLARIMCGLFEADSGTVSYANNVRVALVFQSPKDQIVCSVVSRDTAFGPQNLKLPAGEVELRTIESLAVTGLLHKASAQSMTLSLGQTQKEALAGIIALNPDVLILDEAVSMLDPASRKDIYRFLAYWVQQGNTAVHITHDADAIKEAKDVIMMRRGKIVFRGTTKTFFEKEDLVNEICGEEINKNLQRKKTYCKDADSMTVDDKVAHDKNALSDEAHRNVTCEKTAHHEIAFALESVSFSYGENIILNNINFSLAAGTVTALTGVSGSGKSTLLEIAAGLLAPSSGSVRCNIRPALCQQNSDAALFEQFAADDVAFGARNSGVQGKALLERVASSMDAAGIPFSEYGERETFTLSGGERRRLAIAGILALNSPVLLFDEPTAGLDAPSRAHVLKTLRSLADEGRTVLFSTHRRDEAAFADSELLLENGMIHVDGFMSQCSAHNEEQVYAQDFTDAQSDVILHSDSSARADEQTCVQFSAPYALAEQQPLDGAKLLNSLRGLGAHVGGAEKNNSIISRLPPVAKFIVFFALFISSLAVRPLAWCCALLALSLAYAFFAKYPAKRLFTSLVKVIPLLLLFCIFQMIFFPPRPDEKIFLTYKYFTVTPSKLLLCLKTLIHTEAAIACIVSFSYATPEYDVVDGLSILLKPLALLRVPVRYVIIIVEIIFRFIPLLIDEAESIIKTQLIRGGLGKTKGFFNKVKAIIPLFVPLVIQTIKRSESLADALTVRCFA
ncbi:MAG: ATP-binding cassette domain-containing protein [Treponema sp.]|nr:ATP-binding cassette domain-containing protein [Treponema sp.]